MTFAELQETKGWKNFMSKLYAWGASVVIIGALFKIMHWPGAGPMLVVGLGTEAVIFFFSGFQKLHEELDWTLVYPELAGLDDDDEPIQKGDKDKKVTTTTAAVSLFDQSIFEGVKDAPELMQKLSSGIENLANTANSMSEITNAVDATNGYTDSMNKATNTVSEFTDTYKESVNGVKTSVDQLSSSYNESAETVKYATDNLADSYSKNNEMVNNSTQEVANAYQRLTESMQVDIDFSSVTEGNKGYTEMLSKLNKNLQAVNAVFELQLEAGLDEMMEDLNKSVEESQKYSRQVTQLSQRVEKLNDVYGKMLGAMNVQA